MSASSILFILSVSATIITPSAAKGFLKGKETVSTRELESTLLMELSGSINVTGERIHTFEQALIPLYMVVPKDRSGTLSHQVVRYVLHRFFAQHRGWYIQGLEPSGDARNGSGTALQEWVPSYLQNFLEHLVGGKGLTLRELSVFAATLEDLIHKEAKTWLDVAYNVLRIPKDGRVNEEKLMEVLETYMMLYTIKGNFNADSPSQVHRLHDLFHAKVKNWKDTYEWVHKLALELFPGTHKFSFNDTVSIVELAGERYGTFNDKECGRLKTALLGIESKKPGRVRLVDFYKQSLKGSWDFNEKIEYLRVLGALDESDPRTPLVIMPNYVASRPNCLATSNFYAVCCRNECEDLMQTLEASLREPGASPQAILKLVTALPSDTVRAPRNLSSLLVHRLQHVADIHHGQVPLHGRLFAQWMHHAFPHECPFPHEAGTASPMTPDEWMDGTGEANSKASEDEMRRHVNNDSCHLLPHGMVCGHGDHGDTVAKARDVDAHANDEDLPWKDVEELLVTRTAVPYVAPSGFEDRLPPLYRLVLFAALMPAALMVALYLKTPRMRQDSKVECKDVMWP